MSHSIDHSKRYEMEHRLEYNYIGAYWFFVINSYRMAEISMQL